VQQQNSAVLDTPLTVPNLMSSFRVLMAVVAAFLFATANLEILAVSLCLVGVLLDALDGWYARRFGQCSRLGQFLDPLADKLLMAVIYGVIAVKMNSVPIWILFAMVTSRDFVITYSRSLCIQQEGSAYAADKVGKAKMIVQSAAGIGILGYAYLLRVNFSFSPYPVVIILLVITFLSYISAGRYLFSRAVRS